MIHDFSARSSMYGIHPAPPSESTARRRGKRSKMPLKIQSAKATMELAPKSATVMEGGASLELVSNCDDEPMCMHTGRSCSCTAAHSGSQWSEWTDGSPSTAG